MQIKKKAGYVSFLLRMWQVKERHSQYWRASLENVESGEKCGFTSLEELLAYLRQVTVKKGEEPSEGRESGAQG